MSAEVTTQQSQLPATGIKGISSYLNGDAIKKKFMEVLGESGPSFVASVISACNMNVALRNATPESIYSAALTAATLKLPINPNLGFAFLIPYTTKKGTPQEKTECQFQIAAKGFKQLAQRTCLYQRITDAVVYEGQLIGENPLTGYEFDWKSKKSESAIGYVSYFRLNNGFESIFYMTKDQMTAHAVRYSQTFGSKTQWVKESSKWMTDYDLMALKTVTKLNLSKNGPLSVEMQKAMITDQSVIKDYDTDDVTYVDNLPETKPTVEEHSQQKEEDRVMLFLDKATTPLDLEASRSACTTPKLLAHLELRLSQINAAK